MRKYSVYECDVCGCEEESDGYPRDWIEIQIDKGGYLKEKDDPDDIAKDCCSQACVNKAVLDYYSAHRLEVIKE